ncbi:ABC transporter permease [Chelativorans sp. SCAU2101]|uniref:ABC transporter permease n=1 Tax=Chelativorans petroleitrophicus TaxID=2975484 RepID=A0A9X2X6V7_9HYPH|nr:ABC transporter permease [Chelativorans petroleitrophicus]MCT8990387.1 ABC transporter permease [Chelativorans petroleitrophicus]
MITVYRLLAFGLFLLIWWTVSLIVGPNLIPTPLNTVFAARDLLRDGKILEPLLSSLAVYSTGYALAVLVGIPIGMLMGGIRDLGRTLDIYVNALMATPRVAFIPLIILFLGLGAEAKIAVVFLGAVIPILIGTYSGILNSDAELIEMARSLGASRSQIYWRIMLPGALAFVVIGLRIGATIGLINTVVAELYTAASGLGGLLALYGNTFQMARYFVVILALSLIGGLVSQGLRALEAWSSRWRVTAGN